MVSSRWILRYSPVYPKSRTGAQLHVYMQGWRLIIDWVISAYASEISTEIKADSELSQEFNHVKYVVGITHEDLEHLINVGRGKLHSTRSRTSVNVRIVLVVSQGRGIQVNPVSSRTGLSLRDEPVGNFLLFSCLNE